MLEAIYVTLFDVRYTFGKNPTKYYFKLLHIEATVS
jgi:hypothetical protein